MSISDFCLSGSYEIYINGTPFEIKINLPKQRINLKNINTGDEVSLGVKTVKSSDIEVRLQETNHSFKFWEVKDWGLLFSVNQHQRRTTFIIHLLEEGKQADSTEVIGFSLPNPRW